MSAGFSPASPAMVSNVSPRKPSRERTRFAASRIRAAVGARSGVGSLNGSSYLVNAVTPFRRPRDFRCAPYPIRPAARQTRRLRARLERREAVW